MSHSNEIIDPADLRQGDLFTVSANKVTKDRSYCDLVIRCVNVNETHVQGNAKKRWGPDTFLLVKSEHDFCRADGFEEPKNSSKTV